MKRAVLESKPGSGAGGASSLLSSYRPSTLYGSLGSQTFVKTDTLLALLCALQSTEYDRVELVQWSDGRK